MYTRGVSAEARGVAYATRVNRHIIVAVYCIGIGIIVVVVLKRDDGRLNAAHNPRNRAGFILTEQKAPRTIRERTAGRRPTGRARARTTVGKRPFRVFFTRVPTSR